MICADTQSRKRKLPVTSRMNYASGFMSMSYRLNAQPRPVKA